MDLEKIIKKCEKAIKELARGKYKCCNVFSFGATDINPKHLAIWISTDTDTQRDALAKDDKFKKAVKSILKNNGYPEEAIPLIGIAFQSEETVKRDYGGNWWYAIK